MGNLRAPDSLFGNVSIEEFLSDYWQKKPLYVKSAWPEFNSPIKKKDLFRLAGREDADCRLVLEKGGEYDWEVRFGPFDEEDFEDLGDSHWTLLLQEADRLVPDVNRLLDIVPFLPNWRLDDIMVSYAVDEGGVGAHTDEYDVFLLQGSGSRRWEIASDPGVDEEWIPDLDLRILSNFETTHTWVVEPGDLLYLPPKIAHRGTAIGECMTYSIGCRTPSKNNVVAGYFEQLVADGTDVSPARVPLAKGESETGRLSAEIKKFAHTALTESVRDGEAIDRWLGRFLSTPGRGWTPSIPAVRRTPKEIVRALEDGARIVPAVFAQVLYDIAPTGSILLFVSGEEWEIGREYAEAVEGLCSRQGISSDHFPSDETFLEMITDLINQGALILR